jgi:hypothetical protein
VTLANLQQESKLLADTKYEDEVTLGKMQEESKHLADTKLAAMAQLAPTSRRRSCPYQHAASSRYHGFCCIECRRGEKKHTRNCTGDEDEVTLGNLQQESQLLADFKPSNAGCRHPSYHQRPRDMTVVVYVRQLVESHGLTLGVRAQERWQALADCIESCYPQTRCLHFFPHAQDQIPPRFIVNGTDGPAYVNLAERGVVGVTFLCELNKVTGIDQCMQAVVARASCCLETYRKHGHLRVLCRVPR